MPLERERILERLHELARRGDEFRLRKKTGTYGGYVPDQQGVERWVASCLSVLRLLGEGAPHPTRFSEALGRAKQQVVALQYFDAMLGIVKAAAEDVEAGFLGERDLLVTADAFEGFLEQAEYLLSEGYENAAAVLVGGVLEATLRKICDVHGVPYDPRATVEPLNVALARHAPPVYNKLVQKQITAWADLRNNAAHGRYSEYTKKQVADMLGWVREFAARHLA